MLAIQEEDSEGSGHPSEPQPPPSTTQPTHEEPIPNVVSSSHQKTQTPRQALNQVTNLPQTSEPIPNVPDKAVYEEWDDRVERATTIAASLDAEQASGGRLRCQESMGGSITQTRSERVPTKPYDSPLLRVNTLESDEGSMTLLELMVLCTTLSKKVESLEADLKQTKKVYGAAYTKLIKKVKKLEKTIKSNQARRKAKIMVSDDEELGVFSAAKVLADAVKENVHTYTRRRRAVSTGSGRTSTAEESINTTGASIPVVIKDKGKAKMDESEPKQTKIKLQQRQERACYEAAVRLQEQLDKEGRKRIARVHEEASSFNIEEWEDIHATIEVDEELA
ncbi:hypothetical protein Tco_0631649 [Tanacetum coccineum]